ncbi:MAG TPA: hypothetical protein VLG11_01065 [Candidatus Saccharimonadales bacterium]|nr:hypothetical protein [Candidatus Saccharimonadales bacterium]
MVNRTIYERQETEGAIHVYTPEVLGKLANAHTIMIPRGEHVNPYCIEWLKGLGIEFSSNFMTGKTTRAKVEQYTIEQVRDSAIPHMVDHDGVIGLTAIHQFIEYSTRTPLNLRAGVTTMLKNSRFVVATRGERNEHGILDPDSYIKKLLLSDDPEAHKELSLCSEYPETAKEMLAMYNMNVEVDGLPCGSSEVWLGRRPAPDELWVNRWNAGIFIRGKGKTLEDNDLAYLPEIELPPVRVCAMWPIDGQDFTDALQPESFGAMDMDVLV